MAKRTKKSRPAEDESQQPEFGGEVLRDLLSGEFIAPPSRRKPDGESVLNVDTGMLTQEFSVGELSTVDDAANLAAVVSQSTPVGIAAIMDAAPECLRGAILADPVTSSHVLAGVILERVEHNGRAEQRNGTSVRFSEWIRGCHKTQSPELLTELSKLSDEELVRLRDATMILATLIELRAAAKEGRWQYVAVCAWQIGRYSSLAQCRKQERHAYEARIVKPRAMRRANPTLHDHDTKAQALQLYDKMIAAGKQHKTASAAVKREFGVPARTIREWRKSR